MSEVQIDEDEFPVKTEPLDHEDFYDENDDFEDASSSFLDVPEFPDPTAVVKVKVDSDPDYDEYDDAEHSFPDTRRRKTGSSSTRKKASEMTPDELEMKREKERERKRRERARKRRGCDSDNEVDDPEFTPSSSTSTKTKRKTESSKPRQRKSKSSDSTLKRVSTPKRTPTPRRKKASEMTPEEIEQMRERWRQERQKERAKLSEEELERRRALDRERKRLKRASQPRPSSQTPRRKKVSEMTPEELAANREKWRKEKQAQRKQQELEGKKKPRTLDPDKRREENERRRQYWQSLSKEQRELMQEKGMKRRELEKTVRARLRKGEPLDPEMVPIAEKIKERAEKVKFKRIQRYAEMTEDERRQKRMARYMSHVARIAKLTPEQREAERKKMREYIKQKRAQMTPEEKRRARLGKGYATSMTSFKYRVEKLKKKERLKAAGKWEEYLEQRNEQQRAKRRKPEIKKVTVDKLGRTITRTFESLEDEERFREIRRVCGAKGALKKKLVMRGTPPEEIERQLHEFAKAHQHIVPLVPKRKRYKYKIQVSTGESHAPDSSQTLQSPPSTQAIPIPEANTSKQYENINTRLTFNSFPTRWPTNTAEASESIASATSSVFNAAFPHPPPAHQPYPGLPVAVFAAPNQDQQSHDSGQEDLKEWIDSASSSHYDACDYDDSGSMAYSPEACTPEIPAPPPDPSPPNFTCQKPALEPSPSSSYYPIEPIQGHFTPPTKPKRQTKRKAESIPGKPTRTRNLITAMPVPIVPSRTDYVDNQTSANDPPNNPVYQRRRRTLHQSLRESKFEKNLKCSFCGNFYAKNVFRYHVNGTHHPYYKGGVCTICGERVKLARTFHIHFRTVHGGTGDVRKGDVTYLYPTPPPPPEVLQNTQIVSAEPDPSASEALAPRLVKTSICDICGGTYPTHSLIAHKNQTHPAHYVDGACELCGEKFPKSAAAFRRHFREVHRDKDTPKWPNRKGKYVCEECGSKCNDKYTLTMHKYYMHGEGGRFENFPQCHVCPDKPRFKRRDYLKKHFKRYHPDTEIPGPFRCPAYNQGQGCKLTFFLESMIVSHMAEKHPEQKYECQFCGKLKYSELSLNFHYTIKRCLKAPRNEFQKVLEQIGDNSIDRMKVQCELCKGEFRLSALKDHYEKSHKAKEEPFACNECDRKFLGREFLGMHFIELHAMMPDEWMDSLSKLNMTDRSGVSVEPVCSSEGKHGSSKGTKGGGSKSKKTKSKKKPEPKQKTSPVRRSGRASKKRVELISEDDESDDDEDNKSESGEKEEEEDSPLIKIQEKDAEGKVHEKLVTFKEMQDEWFSTQGEESEED